MVLINMPKVVFHTTKICKKKLHSVECIKVLLASFPTSLTTTYNAHLLD